MHPSKFTSLLSLILTVVLTVVVFTYASSWINDRPLAQQTYGITFSTTYADQLEVSYQEAFQAMVEELGVKYVRLPFYWSEIEYKKGVYDWSKVDWLLDYARTQDIIITPVIGMKVPRWPECYIPDWAEPLDELALQDAVLQFIEQSVLRYKNNTSIIRWQVENEPFFPFGICPSISPEAYQDRVELVRSLDDRPIQVTVSGELGPWLDSAQSADVLGLSLYRKTWNDLFGYFVYPLSPEYYLIRAELVEGYVEKTIISELQAEPWFPESIQNQTTDYWYELFSAQDFQENIEFAQGTGSEEVYLWGAEWWFYLYKHNETRLWETAREIFINHRAL